MNLLARILSHGFAIAIVLLLAIGLIYRGELFPDWELPEFLTLGAQTESDRTDTPAAETPAATAETEASEPATEMAAGEDQPVTEYVEAAAGDTEMPAYIPPAEDTEAAETAQPAETAETAETPGTPEAPQTVETQGAAAIPEAVDAAEVMDTTALGPEGEDAMAAETPPVTTVTETAPEESQPSAEPAVSQEDITVTPTDDSPAADDEPPAAVEIAPVPEPSDQGEISPVPSAPEAAAPEGYEAAPLTKPAESTQHTPEQALSVSPQAEPESELPVASPAVVDTLMAEPVAAPAAEGTATVHMPVAEPVAPSAEATEMPGAKVAPPLSAKRSEENAYQILAAAREAYWLRDYATAESKYLQLMALQPDNPDGYGELGNMYFSQGLWEQSAAAYFEAGTRLVQEGQLEQARQLVDVIRGLDGSQADELNALIHAAQSAAP